jgi:hypothetical protein
MDARGFTLVPDLLVANTHTSKVHSADRRSADHEVLYLRPLNRLVGQQRRFTTGKLAVPFADNRRNLNPVTTRCERVCFEKQYVSLLDRPGSPMASLIHPAHPLMQAVTDLVLEQRSRCTQIGSSAGAGWRGKT